LGADGNDIPCHPRDLKLATTTATADGGLTPSVPLSFANDALEEGEERRTATADGGPVRRPVPPKATADGYG